MEDDAKKQVVVSGAIMDTPSSSSPALSETSNAQCETTTKSDQQKKKD